MRPPNPATGNSPARHEVGSKAGPRSLMPPVPVMKRQFTSRAHAKTRRSKRYREPQPRRLHDAQNILAKARQRSALSSTSADPTLLKLLHALCKRLPRRRTCALRSQTKSLGNDQLRLIANHHKRKPIALLHDAATDPSHSNLYLELHVPWS